MGRVKESGFVLVFEGGLSRAHKSYLPVGSWCGPGILFVRLGRGPRCASRFQVAKEVEPKKQKATWILPRSVAHSLLPLLVAMIEDLNQLVFCLSSGRFFHACLSHLSRLSRWLS